MLGRRAITEKLLHADLQQLAHTCTDLINIVRSSRRNWKPSIFARQQWLPELNHRPVHGLGLSPLMSNEHLAWSDPVGIQANGYARKKLKGSQQECPELIAAIYRELEERKWFKTVNGFGASS